MYVLFLCHCVLYGEIIRLSLSTVGRDITVTSPTGEWSLRRSIYIVASKLDMMSEDAAHSLANNMWLTCCFPEGAPPAGHYR